MRALVIAVSLLVLLPGASRAQESGASDPEGGSEPAAERASAPTRAPVWPWALVAVGGAMFVAAAVTGGLAIARQSELDAVCTHTCPTSVEAAQAEGRALAFSTDALWVGGLVVAAAGLVLSVALPREVEVATTATCGSDGCAVTVRGVF